MKHWKSLHDIYVSKEGNMGLGTLQVGAGFIQVPVVLGQGGGGGSRLKKGFLELKASCQEVGGGWAERRL